MEGQESPRQMKFMLQALELAKKSPPKPTNFRVGAFLLNKAMDKVLATGYTLELPGNTHAEQCCFMKMAQKFGVAEDELAGVLPPDLELYTTVEPCSERLSGNLPCVERILRLAGSIKTVFVGVAEPETFVRNTGKKSLEDAGIEVIHIPGLEQEIMQVATAGHVQSGKS